MSALVIVPPAVGYLAGPLLGPAMLAGCGEPGEVAVVDLSANWLRTRGGAPRRDGRSATIVGDHAKDARVADGYAAWQEMTCLALGLDPEDPMARRRAGRMWVGSKEAERAAARLMAKLETEWEALMPAVPPRFVGISVMFSGQVLGALAVSMLCRRRWPGVPVVWGGSHVTALADAIAADEAYGRWADGFVAGYAEGTFKHMLQNPPLGAPAVFVAGAGTWRRAVEAPTSPRFGALDAYGIPRLTLPAQTTRGCAYGRCAFCTYPANEGAYRAVALRGAEDVVARAAGLGAQVAFKDAFALPRQLDAIGELVAGRVEWSACTRLVPRLGAERLRQLAHQGLRTLEVGVESLDPETLRGLNKRQSVGRLVHLLNDAAGTSVHLVLNVMFGFPGQTLGDAAADLATLDALLARHGTVSVSTERNLLEVERASPMGRQPEQFGIKVRRTWAWASCVEWNAPEWCGEGGHAFTGHHLGAAIGGGR